jgi:predicted P-loop ATPase
MPDLDWLKTGVSVDPDDKDSLSKATKYWIVELGEMEATLKKEQAILKQFFTESTDEYREPYGRFSTKYPRLTCFYATVNDLEFLKDITGNRRYWAIDAISVNVDHNIDLNQLWGEVATLYSTGEITTWLTREEQAALQENNIKFEVKTSAEIKLLDMFDWSIKDIKKWSYIAVSEVSGYIDEKNPVLTGKAIRKLMLNNNNIKFNTNGRKYLLPPKNIKMSRGYQGAYNNFA